MFNTILGYLSSGGTAAIERAVSGLLSLLIAAGSSVGGYMGDTQKMLASGIGRDELQINVDFELTVQADELTRQLDELNTALEKEVGYANDPETAPSGYPVGRFGGYASFFIFNDKKLEFTPTKIPFPKEDIPGIYENGELTLDGNITLTYSESAKCGSAVFDITDVQGEYSLFFDDDTITFSPDLTGVAVGFLGEDLKAVYNEHFESLAYSCDINAFLSSLFDENGRLAKILDGFSFYSHSLPEDLTSLTTDQILTLLEDDEFVSLFVSFFKEYTKPVAKNFVKRTVDGCEARVFELTGKDYLDYRIDHYDFIKDNDRVFDAYKALTDYVHKNEALNFLADSELFEHTEKKEIESAFASRARSWSDIARCMNATPVTRPVPDVNLLRFYYQYTKLKHTIFEKDSDIHTRLEFVLAKKEDSPLVTFKTSTVISSLKDDAPTLGSSSFADKKIDPELLDNKLAQKEAQRLGVSSLEIAWNSKMTSGDISPEISDTEFEVEYKNGESTSKKSLAQLVDGSVYLPLRQLMENAGYEVSWDAEEYKAYVTVDGKKTEMTGKLIDSKTYVKVRDFEKLGATVYYSENVHYANAYDDFSKECTATVSFVKN